MEIDQSEVMMILIVYTHTHTHTHLAGAAPAAAGVEEEEEEEEEEVPFLPMFFFCGGGCVCVCMCDKINQRSWWRNDDDGRREEACPTPFFPCGGRGVVITSTTRQAVEICTGMNDRARHKTHTHSTTPRRCPPGGRIDFD
jgi:hypothetical protein